MKWARLSLFGLLALLSGLALAHAEAPNPSVGAGDFEQSVLVEVVSTAEDVETWREKGPHCRHDQFVLPQGMPRVDLQKIEFKDVRRSPL